VDVDDDSSSRACTQYVRAPRRYTQVARCVAAPARAGSACRCSRQCVLPEDDVGPLARALTGATESRMARRHAHAHAYSAESARRGAAEGRMGALAPVVPESSAAAARRGAASRAMLGAMEE
jgi:hypothetical protein